MEGEEIDTSHPWGAYNLGGSEMLKACTECCELKEWTHDFFPKNGGGRLRSTCRECTSLRMRNWVDQNQDRSNQIQKKKYESKKFRGYYSTEVIKESSRIRGRIRAVIRRGVATDEWLESILCCSIDSFLRHIESQFSCAMNWGNYGEWHLDHIKPIASARDKRDVILLNHWSNMRPLWAYENHKKGATFDKALSGAVSVAAQAVS